MKKLLSIFIILILGVCVMGVIYGCATSEKNDEGGIANPPVSADGRLSSPDVKLAEGVIYWDSVENADYYEVFLNGRPIKVTLETYYPFFFGRNGTYSLTVVARSLGTKYAKSEHSVPVVTSVNRIDLAEPNLSIDGNVVRWGAVEGATDYDVYVNSEVLENADYTVKNNTFSWTCLPEKAGKNTIRVCAISNNSEYETQSDLSNEVCFEVSNVKRWDNEKFLADWDGLGSVEMHGENICLECISYSSSGIANYCLIDAEKPYLFIDFCNVYQAAEDNGAKIKVYVNGNIVRSAESNSDYTVAEGECTLSYDMSRYVSKVVEIKIENCEGKHACIEQIVFSTKDRVSPYSQWNTENFEEEWGTDGKVVVHPEGICLEYESREASIFNTVFVLEKAPFFCFDLRKFERLGEKQDKDPQVYVYVNDSLILSLTGEQYATAKGDTVQKYIYDLREFVGQPVEIRLVNKQGDHACIPDIYFSSKGEYSTSTSWDIPFIQQEWEFEGKVEVHAEGVCLENNGSAASMKNKVEIHDGHSTFVISFRKFVRTGVQDKDPKISVYVNGELIRANGAESDVVTALTDDYVAYEYDFSRYAGQVVTIEIKNISGEHACFDTVYFQ